MKWNDKRKSSSDSIGVIIVALTLLMAAFWRTDISVNQLAFIVPVLFVGGVLMSLGIVLGLRRAQRWNWKPEKIFLLLFVPLSLGMMLAMPVWRAPDESAHLQRIWQISLGNWFPDEETQGIFLEPANLLDGVRDFKETTLYTVARQWNSTADMDQLVESDVGANTGIYPVSNYFPQALGMALVRLMTKGRMAMFYGARLGAWLATLGLFYYAIRIVPVGKYAMIALTLLPMMLQEAASASADGMTCAACMALTAFVVRACECPERFGWKDTAVLAGLMALVGTLKMMYCPLILLSFAIPACCFGSERRKKTILGTIAIAIACASIAWMLFCNAAYVGAGTGRGDSMREQVAWMLGNPGELLAVMGRTVYFRFGIWMEQIIGKDLGWLNVPIPSLVFWSFVFVLMNFMHGDDALSADHQQIRVFRKLGIALSAVCVLIVLLSLYIWETPCANPTVLGIQGRYFIPLLPLLYMALKHKDGSGVAENKGNLKAVALLDVCTLGFVFIHTIL